MNSVSLAASPSDALLGWVTEMMEALGAPGAAVAIFAENLFPPIPSEIVLALAGFTASQGTMSLIALIVWTTLGSVLGAVTFYYLGALLGRDRTRRIAARIPLVKISDIDRTERWFTRHGRKAVFFGRMVPIFRTFVSLPAGVERMAIPTFLLFTTIGSVIWNSGLIIAGYLLGENWHVVDDYMGIFQNVVLAAIVLALAGFAVVRMARRRTSRA